MIPPPKKELVTPSLRGMHRSSTMQSKILGNVNFCLGGQHLQEMELGNRNVGHLASSKQASSKLDPQGPRWAPEQQGSQNWGKNVTTLSGDGVGTTNNGLWAPEGPCLGRQSAPCAWASGRARGGPRVGPQEGPKWPRCTKNGPRCLRGGPPEGSVVQVGGQNQLGYCLGCLLAVFGPMWPRNGVRWAQNGFIWAPNVSCGLKPKNGRISG